jgi:predicted nucleic acid-binding protein
MMIGDDEALFIDTNILVYASISSAPLHQIARQRITAYQHAGVQLWLSRQVLREYLSIVTRPQIFATPLDAKAAVNDIRLFQQQFQIANETAEVTERLLTLLEQVQVGGKQVHDANIVATMETHGIKRLLTHNVDDFNRFSSRITIVTLEELKK